MCTSPYHLLTLLGIGQQFRYICFIFQMITNTDVYYFLNDTDKQNRNDSYVVIVYWLTSCYVQTLLSINTLLNCIIITNK